MPVNQLLITVEEETTGTYLEAMHPELARRTAKWYVCSRCWSELQERETEQGVLVECVSCGEETCGYVTRYWTEQKRSQDHFEMREVTRMLQKIGVLPAPPPKTIKQNLKELGF